MKELPAAEPSRQALEALAHLERALTSNDTAIGYSTRDEILARLHRLLGARDVQLPEEADTPAESITVRLRTVLTLGSRTRTDDIAKLTGFSQRDKFVVTRIDISGEMWTDTAYDIARRLGLYDEFRRELSSATRMDRIYLDYHAVFDEQQRPALLTSISGDCTTDWNPAWIPQLTGMSAKITVDEGTNPLRITITTST